jgi:hypothetical protein
MAKELTGAHEQAINDIFRQGLEAFCSAHAVDPFLALLLLLFNYR